jgi:site-specific DNA-methyltransferase (adenine-specific)
MKLINADCIEAMKAMPDNSVDSIVTDPPYELGFMGKSWDASGIAFNVEVWQEALRVIKPGGHLIAFSGSRTYHRMAVAIEDAGFQIRDQIMWVYGSGFPKSLNIAKSIENKITTGSAAKNSFHKLEGERTGEGRIGMYDTVEEQGFRKVNPDQLGAFNLDPTTPEAKQWQGWGTALKPAHEPMVLARKPLEGTVANNVLTFGVGGLNIDGTRVGSGSGETKTVQYPDIRGNNYNNASGSVEYTVTDQGRFPANFIHDGSDEVVALFPDTKGKVGMTQQASTRGLYEGGTSFGDTKISDGIADSGSAARFFYCAKASKRDRNEGLEGFAVKQSVGGGGGIGDYLDDVNSASGKFGSEKAPAANNHPTVKPTSLMQYLVKLVTPPNGIVLDPFMGSGSTGKACTYEGFDFIGIEQSSEYVAIAQARIDFALADKSNELPL